MCGAWRKLNAHSVWLMKTARMARLNMVRCRWIDSHIMHNWEGVTSDEMVELHRYMSDSTFIGAELKCVACLMQMLQHVVIAGQFEGLASYCAKCEAIIGLL